VQQLDQQNQQLIEQLLHVEGLAACLDKPETKPSLDEFIKTLIGR